MLGENGIARFSIAGDVPVILGAVFIALWVGVWDHATALGAMQAWCLAQYLSIVPLAAWGWSWLRWLVSHRPDFALMRSMLTYTGVMGLGAVIAAITGRVDQLLVRPLDGRDSAGIYSSAIAVAHLLLLFSSSVTMATFHSVGRGDPSRAAALTATAVRHTVLVVMGGGVAAALVGPSLIELAFGREYIEASTPLRILCLGTALHAPTGLVYLYFMNQMGRPGIPVLIGLGGLVVSMAGCLLLIPPFGTAGAAWATTFSYVFSTGAALWVFLKKTHVSPAELWRIRISDLRAYTDLGLSLLGDFRALARRATGRLPVEP
jgi:O-antigen/teichoic acid export membrane protein